MCLPCLPFSKIGELLLHSEFTGEWFIQPDGSIDVLQKEIQHSWAVSECLFSILIKT